MNVNIKHHGGNMVEYVLPLAVIGLVVGLGLYYLSSNGDIRSSVLKDSEGQMDLRTGKVAMGGTTSTEGVYVDNHGNITLTSKKGNSIIVPQKLYDMYKEDIDQYFDQGKFDFTSAFTETSGAMGIEDVVDNATNTKMYSRLIEIAAKNNSDTEAKELLGKMSSIGFDVGDIEEEMLSLNTNLEKYRDTFKEQKEIYESNLGNFKAMLAQAEGDLSADQIASIDNIYAQIQKDYAVYKKAAEEYEAASKEALATAEARDADLKTGTGAAFDQVLQDIVDCSKIDDLTKDMVVPVGKKIQAVKDSVSLIEEMISSMQFSFSDIDNSFSSTTSQFKSFHTEIDKKAGDQCLSKSPPPNCKR